MSPELLDSVRVPMAISPLPVEPLVSVIVPSYNHSRYVGEMLDSVLGQTYRRWELIICDDASDDDSVEVIREHAGGDPRTLLFGQDHGGEIAALNSAYAKSSGEIICLLNSDDLMLPDKLAAVVEEFRSTNAGYLQHWLYLVDGSGHRAGTMPPFHRFVDGWLGPRIVDSGGTWQPQTSCGQCLRREVADLIYPLPPDVIDDTFTGSLAPLISVTAVINRPLGGYRWHGGNTGYYTEIDDQYAESLLAEYGTATTRINERLEAMGLTSLHLDLENNLTAQQLRFIVSLSRREDSWLKLARRYVQITRRIARDRVMYRPVRRVIQVLMLGAALVLPGRLRRAAMTSTLGHGRLKEKASDAWRRVISRPN